MSRSSKELDEYLKDNNYTKYVEYKESYKTMFDKYPVLTYFLDGYTTIWNTPIFRSKWINEYVGKEICEYQEHMDSKLFNKILNEVYRKYNTFEYVLNVGVNCE